ncbi:pentatricopeptide repeat-containing protein At2g03880, mitochondrial-like [Selaginella moellendorffii]|uniref:pentatricopeptide repeat-containing protein At2g03880, mitochondrial-like n=1 Tax=Selaginella moellendorffii TaxID=88036 RepID=UPI000D1D0E21|nr:pentatricopeptide repeat-containing protein At2g03880, mitochondrial-like [Selaginella moellendorffii]|eukprot:XP_024535252.1 pentatricopeptide repeat-containing protein At2g03880, mitochondrial-like [Selaginella moellendorffii]
MAKLGLRSIFMLMAIILLAVGLYQRLWVVQMDLNHERHNRFLNQRDSIQMTDLMRERERTIQLLLQEKLKLDQLFYKLGSSHFHHGIRCVLARWKLLRGPGFVREICQWHLRARNALIYMFAECGSLDKARGVFDGMDRDSVSWNTIFTAYGNDELTPKLRAVARRPFLSLKSWIWRASPLAGREVHARVISSGVRRNYILDNALLRCGSLHDAKKVRCLRNGGCLRSPWPPPRGHLGVLHHGRGAELGDFHQRHCCLARCWRTRKLHSRIQSRRIKLACGRELSSEVVRKLRKPESSFELISRKDASSWNALMVPYIQQNECCGALALAKRPRRHQAGLRHLRLLDHGHRCCRQLRVYGQANPLTGSRALLAAGGHGGDSNALINMYAARVFEEMPVKNDTSWTAPELSRSTMNGAPPCDITLNVVLLACNHSGLQEEAWYHFTYTSRDYGVELKRVHYHCMLDVLARQDLLEEACHLLTTMPCEGGNTSFLHGGLRVAPPSSRALPWTTVTLPCAPARLQPLRVVVSHHCETTPWSWRESLPLHARRPCATGPLG